MIKKQQKEQLTYTLILHNIRKRLKLSLMEYCIADSIYHLSNNPNSKIRGWCYASKNTIANTLGTTSVTIFDNIKKLLKKDLVEKDEDTKYLRTTAKWYENVVLIRSNIEYQETLYPIKKLDSKVSRNFIPTYKETLYNNNSNKDIDNKKKELSYKNNSKSCKYKPTYDELEMRWYKNKWWVLPVDGGDWKSFSLEESKIIWINK